jgi:hypothetical protein
MAVLPSKTQQKPTFRRRHAGECRTTAEQVLENGRLSERGGLSPPGNARKIAIFAIIPALTVQFFHSVFHRCGNLGEETKSAELGTAGADGIGL